MKKIFTLCLLFCALAAKADLPVDGYYRVQNYVTARYAYITDDKGEVNYHTTSADLKALQLYKNFELAISDPATVIYIKNIQGSDVKNQYDLLGQGCGVHSMMDLYVRMREASNKAGKPVYCYATYNDVTRYLGDAEVTDMNKGGMSDSAEGDYRLWNLLPVDQSDDRCFGVKSTIEAEGNFWRPFFASFPFAISAGMEAYIVTKLDTDYGVAVIEPIANGIVPAATPVLIKCSSSVARENKLEIGATGGNADGNLLKGVYFCNTSYTHKNVLPYDKDTMRVLSVNADGKLAFVTDESLENVPRNEAYVKLPKKAQAELLVLTPAEYEEYLKTATGIIDVVADGDAPFDVYNLSGMRVRTQVRSLDDLPSGIYIANGKKIHKK